MPTEELYYGTQAPLVGLGTAAVDLWELMGGDPYGTSPPPFFAARRRTSGHARRSRH